MIKWQQSIEPKVRALFDRAEEIEEELNFCHVTLRSIRRTEEPAEMYLKLDGYFSLECVQKVLDALENLVRRRKT